ncbi:MAG: acyltransferase family protein [Steroidobacteraceae bacterium]
MAYRPDVDGLRAVAVLAVLAFHAFPGAVPGGFVGVDIFFVISGFLISGIILNELQNDAFTIARFYNRRIRRIFPALAITLSVCLACGWWLLLPAQYRQLGGHVAAGAGFVSNLQLWSESGYFDTAAADKPLLHLWSLGVEEQYYLLWPLFLVFMHRNLRQILWMILAIAVASFCLNVLLVPYHVSAAFYLPVTRLWELMLGSVLACLAASRTRAPGQTSERRDIPRLSLTRARLRLSNAMATVGAVLMVVAVALDYDERYFPGWWALLPAVATMLLIAAGPAAWVNRKVLSQPAVVFIGLISYPLYLWHWPLLTYARIVLGETPPIGVRVGLLVASGLLACLTYELVEKKIRRTMPQPRAQGVAAILVVAVAGLGVCGWLALEGHIPARAAAVPRLAGISAAFDDWAYDGDRVIRGDTPRAVLFFGDSHMQQFLPRIEQVMRARRAPVRTAIFETLAGCAPIPGIEREGRHCARFVAAGLARAHQADVEIVVIGASWVGLTDRVDYYRTDAQGGMVGVPLELHTVDLPWVLQGFEVELRSLVAAGKRVVVVLSTPGGERFDPRSMVQRRGWQFQVKITSAVPRSEIVAEQGGIDARLVAIAHRVGAEIVNPMDEMCTALVCATTDADGNPFFMDETHVRSSVVRAHFDQLDPYVYLNAARVPPGNPRSPYAVTQRGSLETSSYFQEPYAAEK